MLPRVLQLPTPALQSGGTDARPGILPPSARSSGGLTRDKTGRGNAGLMERAENDSTVFRPSHKTLKIDETDFHIPTASTTTEQFFHLKPEKPVQTIGATSRDSNQKCAQNTRILNPDLFGTDHWVFGASAGGHRVMVGRRQLRDETVCHHWDDSQFTGNSPPVPIPPLGWCRGKVSLAQPRTGDLN